MVQKTEYHTLRCNFSDLQAHLNEYAKKGWCVRNIAHGQTDDRMVFVVMERDHKAHPKGGF